LVGCVAHCTLAGALNTCCEQPSWLLCNLCCKGRKGQLRARVKLDQLLPAVAELVLPGSPPSPGPLLPHSIIRTIRPCLPIPTTSCSVVGHVKVSNTRSSSISPVSVTNCPQITQDNRTHHFTTSERSKSITQRSR